VSSRKGLTRGAGHALGCVALGIGLGLVSLAACGSRTALYLEPVADAQAPPGPEAEAGVDGVTADVSFGFDAPPPFDVHVAPDSSLRCTDGGPPTAYVLDQSGALWVFSPDTLALTRLGTPSCPTDTGTWTLSVSREGIAYILYQDWNLYAVDLATLACTRTPFVPGQLGLDNDFAIAISRTGPVEKLFVYGISSDSMNGAGPILASGDLTSFVLTEIAPALPTPPPDPLGYDTQADLFGHLFSLTAAGQLSELDVATASVLRVSNTGFPGAGSSWAVMTFNDEVYLFGDSNVARYNFTTHSADMLGSVSPPTTIVGASAVPCLGIF